MKRRLPLLLIIVIALALRLAGLGWGLPDQRKVLSYHPDEGVNLIQGALDHGIPRPHLKLGFYNYGSLYFYFWQVGNAVNQTYNIVKLPQTGYPSNPSSDSPAAMILVGRLLSVLFGVVTVPIVYLLGKSLYDRSAGLFSAAAMALMPVAVVHSHYATVDNTAVFLVTCSLLFAATSMKQSSPKKMLKMLIITGVFCGLASAVKYNVAIVLLSPLAIILTSKENPAKKIVLTAICSLSALFAFALACPGIWLENDIFVRHFIYELRKSQAGMGLLFAGTGNGFWYHLHSSLRYGMGLPMLVAGIVGFGYALYKRDRGVMLLMAFILPYYMMIGMAQVRFLRYVLPLMPVFSVFIGMLLSDCMKLSTWNIRVAVVKWSLVCLLTLLIDMALIQTLRTPDTRDLACDYLERTARGSSIAFATTPWFYTPPLSQGFTFPSPADRREAASSSGLYHFIMPAKDQEWELSVLASRPERVVLSEFETMDALRVKLPATLKFIWILRRDYKPVVFDKVPSYAGISLGKTSTPPDWLYPFPRITVWERMK